jgi:autotransporter-associated beta strand protein
MNVTRGIWRPLRWLLILGFVGGAVLAADNSWMSSLRVGRFKFSEWLDSLLAAEPRTADLALSGTPARVPETRFSTNQWLNRHLFSQPATGWTLDSAKSAATPILKIQSSALSSSIVESNSTALPTAFFSSGFVSYSTVTFGPLPSAPTASGIWALNSSGTWGNSTNWAGGAIADGAGNTADFSSFDLTHDIIVTLDTSRTIGDLYIGDFNGTNTYNIAPQSGSTLTFDDNTGAFSVHSILQQVSTSAGDTISANIFVKNDLDINNLSATHEFTIAGNIASSGANNSSQLLWFNNHDTTSNAAGNVRVTGNITNGSTGATLNVVIVNGGTVTFSGTNTYTGFTEIDGGTLLINGNNSAATGMVSVYPTGTLGGTGTVGGNMFVFGGTITGATATTVGTLTLLGNANFTTGEGAGGTYLANLSGSLSDLLAITGTLTLGADTTLNIVGAADNVTTYILATFASHTDTFATVTGIPSGYALIYNATDLELVPIPEPATWIGGALTLGAIGFAWRRVRHSARA